MHFVEIVALRGTTVIPMCVLGFTPLALQAYILLFYVHSTFVHANIGWNFDRLGRFLVIPRFHHWHHGIEKEAIDVNFAIHFPCSIASSGRTTSPRAPGRPATALRDIRSRKPTGGSSSILSA